MTQERMRHHASDAGISVLETDLCMAKSLSVRRGQIWADPDIMWNILMLIIHVKEILQLPGDLSVSMVGLDK